MKMIPREDLDSLRRIFDSSDWDELELSAQGVELRLSKKSPRSGRMLAVTAPHVATFHRASLHDDRPFVEVGDCVSPDTPVGRLVVLGRSKELHAGCHGVVREILAREGLFVTFADVLMKIEAFEEPPAARTGTAPVDPR